MNSSSENCKLQVQLAVSNVSCIRNVTRKLIQPVKRMLYCKKILAHRIVTCYFIMYSNSDRYDNNFIYI